MNSDKHRLKITLWISISLYVSSLFFPGFSTDGPQKNDDIGIILVVFGWYDVFGNGAGYVWFANPLIWFAWSTIRNPKRSVIFGLCAFTLMLLFAFSKSITRTGPCGSWLEPSDCSQVSISALHVGYYLWIASAVAFVSGNFIRILSNQAPK